ncbi:hypothetical protein Pan44_40240 [Caulifigura coniformis]|uniref:Uncharacterized protein n=1 Tax=Caulifigura coniformis TaxID=2527983 RepID=A0A517SIN2_9PLAN|nr:hypothetical protein [Caulifigura coniformis]QDT55975.1 hypothetical protein Pan44_40240 [Caulifigura coniformis]
MPSALIDLMHALYERWRDATPTDFLTLGVAIIAIGWLAARLSAEA